MSWTVRPWLRRTLTAWREVSAAAAARLALSACSARSPRRSLTTLLCSLLRSFSSYSKEQRSVVSEKRARRPRSQPCPHRNRNTLSLPTGDHESPHTPGVRGANLEDASDVIKAEPLPPCTRGERARDHHDGPGGASTPACAGQTGRPPCAWWPPCLYPRVRGANRPSTRRPDCSMPLPPRARGKLEQFRSSIRISASTPACAGQTGEGW